MYTHETYHSHENTHLSNSKMRDFVKSKSYFYKKHITHEIVQEPTGPLIIGNMVDTLVTSGKEKFDALFVPVARRNLKNPPEGYIEVTQGQYDEAIGVANAVILTDAYKELMPFQRQVILTKDGAVGVFAGLCGMLDFLWISDDKSEATIVDLKTASSIDPRKYYWHVLEYGYHNQMALYIDLVMHNFPMVKKIDCFHLVVEKDPEDIYRTRTFVFTPELLHIGKVQNDALIAEIAVESTFVDDPTSFTTALPLQMMKHTDQTISGDVGAVANLPL